MKGVEGVAEKALQEALATSAGAAHSSSQIVS
jgi:hypothetical protein